MKSLTKIKRGDLVSVIDDPRYFFGYGIVLDVKPDGQRAKIHWFDHFGHPKERQWENTSALGVVT